MLPGARRPLATGREFNKCNKAFTWPAARALELGRPGRHDLTCAEGGTGEGQERVSRVAGTSRGRDTCAAHEGWQMVPGAVSRDTSEGLSSATDSLLDLRQSLDMLILVFLL